MVLDAMNLLVLAIYAWGCYSAWIFFTGRNAWLDAKGIPNVAVKLCASLLLGLPIAGIRIFGIILGFLGIQWLNTHWRR